MKITKEQKQKVKELLIEKQNFDELIPKIDNQNADYDRVMKRCQELSFIFDVCFSKLTQEEQRILMLHNVERYADFEIAIELGYSERKIWSMRQAAIAKFLKITDLFAMK